jgi:hypothetical protein
MLVSSVEMDVLQSPRSLKVLSHCPKIDQA